MEPLGTATWPVQPRRSSRAGENKRQWNERDERHGRQSREVEVECVERTRDNMIRIPIRLIILISAALISRGVGFAEDTELRDLDVSHWSCLNKPAGTAT